MISLVPVFYHSWRWCLFLQVIQLFLFNYIILELLPLKVYSCHHGQCSLFYFSAIASLLIKIKSARILWFFMFSWNQIYIIVLNSIVFCVSCEFFWNFISFKGKLHWICKENMMVSVSLLPHLFTRCTCVPFAFIFMGFTVRSFFLFWFDWVGIFLFVFFLAFCLFGFVFGSRY